MTVETAAKVAALEARADAVDRRFTDLARSLDKVEAALWGAVGALRARPQVHPIATAIIGALTAALGALTAVALR